MIVMIAKITSGLFLYFRIRPPESKMKIRKITPFFSIPLFSKKTSEMQNFLLSTLKEIKNVKDQVYCTSQKMRNRLRIQIS